MRNTAFLAGVNDRPASIFWQLLFSGLIVISWRGTTFGAATVWEGPSTGGVFNDDANWSLNSPGDNPPPQGLNDNAYFDSNTNVDGTITFDADVTHTYTFVENSAGTMSFDTGEFKWTMGEYFGIKNDFSTESSGIVRHINGEIQSKNILIGYAESDNSPTLEIVGSNTHWHTTYESGGYGVGYAPFVDGATLIVRDGASMTALGPALIGLQGSSNGKLVIDGVGTEMVLGNNLAIGYTGYEFGGDATNNRAEIINGAHATSSHILMGISVASPDNTLMVSGAGTKYTLTGINGNDGTSTHIGRAGNNNLWRIENGAVVEGNNRLTLGFAVTSTNNKIEIDNGSLSGTGIEIFQQGNVSITNGTVDLVQWFDENVEVYKGGGILATNPLATYTFNSGTLRSVNATVTNGAAFTVGNGGANSATYFMRPDVGGNRGTHVFASGLVLASNGILAGNGNVTANVSGSVGAKVDVGASAGIINVTGNWNNTGIGIALELDNIAASTTPGLEFDQLNVSGAFTHGGTVTIDRSQLVGPAADTQLKLIGWGSQVGLNTATIVSFLGGSALPYAFQADGLYVTLAASAGLAGDYNGNGTVDAADYTIYRNNVGQATLNNRGPGITGPVGPADYAVWKSHFGEGMGSGAAAGAAIPEPGTLILVMGFVLLGLSSRSRSR